MASCLRTVRNLLVLLTTTALLATAGCSSSSETGPQATAGSSSVAGQNYPATITSALGAVTINAEPQRVVTLGWGSTEAAIALGTVPVGMPNMASDSGTPDGIMPWVKDKLNGATPELFEASSKEVPLEKIAALRPDVILAVQSGITAEQYAQLSKIAPTVAYPGRKWQTSWQDQTTVVGKALGKEAQAASLVSNINAQLTKVKAEHPEFAGKTVAASSVTTSTGMSFYFDTDPRTQILGAMGFTVLPALTQLRESANSGAFAQLVSWENIADYSADVMTTWYLDSSLQRTTEANLSFRGLPAVTRKSYVPLTDPPLVFAASSPNVLDVPWLLSRYVPLLSAAASR